MLKKCPFYVLGLFCYCLYFCFTRVVLMFFLWFHHLCSPIGCLHNCFHRLLSQSTIIIYVLSPPSPPPRSPIPPYRHRWKNSLQSFAVWLICCSVLRWCTTTSNWVVSFNLTVNGGHCIKNNAVWYIYNYTFWYQFSSIKVIERVIDLGFL